ncbi:MAG: hypothetical protein LBR79_04260 [Oscillospiraceae bacterium]|nr:hypothetical protein [Oscillospiraceae bacterium]
MQSVKFTDRSNIFLPAHGQGEKKEFQLFCGMTDGGKNKNVTVLKDFYYAAASSQYHAKTVCPSLN